MAVIVTWVEFNGASPGSGNGTALATNINFGSTDSANIDTASHPIAAGSNSYAKFWKAQWSGSFTSISNAKLYKSDGDYVSGEVIKFSGNYTKVTPSNSPLPNVGTAQVPDIPETLPGSNNICLPDMTTDILYQADYESSPNYASGARSSMMAFQLQTESGIAAGPVNRKTFSLVYDRN